MRGVSAVVVLAAALSGCSQSADSGGPGETPAAEACRVARLDATVPEQHAEMKAWARRALAGEGKQEGVSRELNDAATVLALAFTPGVPETPPDMLKGLQAKVVSACAD
jgi:hypothetical protein